MAVSSSPTDLPATVGRYRVHQRIASGSFGVVYRSEDLELGRPVAIKVLHRHLLQSDASVNAFLREARILAGLEHRGIVPVYDIGCTEDGLYFLVARYIEGLDLHTRLQRERLPRLESVEVVAQSAEALAHAHQRGLVHRDVNPRNLMLDASGRVYVIDFGLALRQEDFGTGPGFVGTVLYMSPEQARGEGHRVDARTDIYSLGVVFYELCTGQRPFTSKNRAELLERISTREPPPPREINDSLPVELERICLKALAFRAADRYASAQTFADELRAWLSCAGSLARPADPKVGVDRDISATRAAATAPRIVPKGLRSFTAGDADFFLELLPGPRAGDGLPESLRFWKTRLESTEPDQAFGVGLLYGPSGCGKTSLVTAGLLPRLADSLHAVYVEATADRTEAAVNTALRRRFPWVPPDQHLAETLSGLRRGRGLPAGHKVVLVLDQFEQWLHAPRAADDTELVRALRQCDGLQVQCLLLVRDDFWLSVSRLMRDLEVPLVEGHNTALVDLFDLPHARKVLAECGRAYGRLPDNLADCTPEQQRFLDRAVEVLAENGKVFPIRLILFVEMVKGKPWTPATLHVGGAEGIGVQFLEENFSAATAPTEHRLHQKAARAVLQALLPEGGTNLKGHRRSHVELLSASGYARHPQAFADLLRILDRELRLITPTTEEMSGVESVAVTPDLSLRPAAGRFYQLAHDYLVPSVRQWLTREQRQTWRGRKELLLTERSADWNLRREPRNLPGWTEWISIRLATRRPWSETQRQLMRAADRYHLRRTAVVFVMVVGIALAGSTVLHQFQQANHVARADALVAQVTNPEDFQPAQLASVVERYHSSVVPRLQALLDDPRTSRQERLQIRLVLLSRDPGQVAPLTEALLTAAPPWVEHVCKALTPYKNDLAEDLWRRVENPRATADVRLRSACALAAFDPESTRWAANAPTVTTDLLGQNTIFLSYWLQALGSVRAHLIPSLARLFRDTDEHDYKLVAAEALAVYAGDRPELLAELLADADARQFAVLWPAFRARPESARALMEGILTQLPAAEAQHAEREKLARRQAQAAAALLLLGKTESVWPLLRHSPDPTLRSYLIHLLSPLGVSPEALVQRYHVERDVSVRRALLLSLGEFTAQQWSPDSRQRLAQELLECYRAEPDPGLRAAAAWLLDGWGYEKRLAEITRELAVRKQTTNEHPRPQRWYVNGQGQTMVVIPGPEEFMMGPSAGEHHFANEVSRRARIPQSYAIAATEVTVEQFLRFHPDRLFMSDFNRQPQHPISRLSRLEAMKYCRWLSEREGIPEEQMCYPPVDKIKPGEPLPVDRSRSGYRLPTEAEWEYACRADSRSSRFYGLGANLLGKYAWYVDNSRGGFHRVGTLKPNDWGLFDLYGNVREWCDDIIQPGGPDHADEESRVLRGGSGNDFPLAERSSYRYFVPRADHLPQHGTGLRVARTCR